MARRPIRLLIAVTTLALRLPAASSDADHRRPSAIIIAPSRTSIYIGRITLTLSALRPTASTFVANYSAKVFPYFFYNEAGEFSLDVPAEDFARLAAGSVVSFHGRAVSSDAEERKVEGTATPTGSDSGKIKVRIYVSPRIQLIFNTTYALENNK